MAPNVLLSYSSGLCKIKIYDCVMLEYSYTSNLCSLTNKPSDPNVEKYFHEGPRKNYYHPNGYINIEQDYIYFSLPCFFLIFYLLCTYKKVISFSTSYGNWTRPWPVQFIWTSWHWQSDAISEHMKSKMHCYKESSVFTIQYILQNCIKILQQLLSSSSQVKSQSNSPSHTIDWCIQGPRWHLNSFSSHLELTKKQ